MTVRPVDLERLAVYREWLTAGLISRAEYLRLRRGDLVEPLRSRADGTSRGILHRANRSEDGPS